MEKRFVLQEGSLQIPCRCNGEGEIRRLVIGVHGLGGSSEDEIQCILAEEMELFYSAVYRFDFPAHGENPENELTLAGCRESLLAVARKARADHPQVEDLCIFATGFGAYITLVTLQELLALGGNIRLVVQTPSVRMHETLLRMARVSLPTFRAMDKVTFHTRRPFDVSYRFYKDVLANLALVRHPIPMLILHGEEDSYIPMDDIRQFHRINEDSRLVIIPGTSHRFLEVGAWDMVLDLTRDWFEHQQVLLSDWF